MASPLRTAYSQRNRGIPTRDRGSVFYSLRHTGMLEAFQPSHWGDWWMDWFPDISTETL